MRVYRRTSKEVQLLLTNRQTLVLADVRISLTQNTMMHSFPCCAVQNCPLVNDCDLLAGFSDFYHVTPSITTELSGSYLIWENWNGWATIWRRSHDYRLSRLGTMHLRDRHTDSHVAIANAAPTHCVRRQKCI